MGKKNDRFADIEEVKNIGRQSLTAIFRRINAGKADVTNFIKPLTKSCIPLWTEAEAKEVVSALVKKVNDEQKREDSRVRRFKFDFQIIQRGSKFIIELTYGLKDPANR